MKYFNYHMHTDYSNPNFADSITKFEDYCKRAIELGHTHLSTCEHGYAGNFLEKQMIAKKYNINVIYVVEAYFVEDRKEKDKSNYHIVLIAKNEEGFKKISKALSIAADDGFYYKARLDYELLETLVGDVYITTACVGGITKEEHIEKLYNIFKNDLFLEVQSHNEDIQKEVNTRVLELSSKYNIKIVHANDSHYLLPQDKENKNQFILGCGMKVYDSNFIEDYPDTSEILNRYRIQGVLNPIQVKEALENTLLFEKAYTLNRQTDVKMPKVYENPIQQLKQIINEEWIKERDNLQKERHKEYLNVIREEIDIIEKTDMAEYFVLNYNIIKRAKELGAVLSRTGRGSAVSFYVNYLLGFTGIDRLQASIKLYPTRFMSVARILKSRSLPDIDFNFAERKQAIQASKEILGENGIYYMMAFGKLKERDAFKTYCRYLKSSMLEEEAKVFNSEYNEVSKDLENYKDDKKWRDIIKESEKFIDVIKSVSPAPCSFILSSNDIREEFGIYKIKDEYCAMVDGKTADKFGYLKNDYLKVDVWELIDLVCQKIKKPIPTIQEITKITKGDIKTWNIYHKGLTATVNQVNTYYSKKLVREYKPRTIEELSAFVAAIRPGFISLQEKFVKRKNHSNGIKEIDEVLNDSYRYLLYQENIMTLLQYFGLSEEATCDIVKKISKKNFEEQELIDLKTDLKSRFESKLNRKDGFEELFQVIYDAGSYSFNASHSLSVALDSIYQAYLKAHHTLDYYEVALNHYIEKNKTTSIDDLKKELKYFGIQIIKPKFRKSAGLYKANKETRRIYEGIGQIKFLTPKLGEELYNIKEEFETFTDLLIYLTHNTSANTRQIEILIKENYFDMFDKSDKLIMLFENFKAVYKKNNSENHRLNKREILISREREICRKEG